MSDTDRLAELLHAEWDWYRACEPSEPGAPCHDCIASASRLIAAGVTLAPTPPDAALREAAQDAYAVMDAATQWAATQRPASDQMEDVDAHLRGYDALLDGQVRLGQVLGILRTLPSSPCWAIADRLIAAGVTLAPTPPDAPPSEVAALTNDWPKGLPYPLRGMERIAFDFGYRCGVDAESRAAAPTPPDAPDVERLAYIDVMHAVEQACRKGMKWTYGGSEIHVKTLTDLLNAILAQPKEAERG